MRYGMDGFIYGLFQNLVADAIFFVIVVTITWLVARRFRWRTITSLFRLQRNGVSNIYLNRSEYISRRSRSVLEFIETAEKTFTYVGVYFSLATDQSRIDNTIRALVLKGCHIKIILLNDESSDDIFNYLEDHFALAKNSLRARVHHAKEYFVGLRLSLAPAQRSLLEVRIHKLPLTSSAFLIDQSEHDCTMLIDNKWYAAGREKSLGIDTAIGLRTGLKRGDHGPHLIVVVAGLRPEHAR
jgi:hypothetical protein